MKTRTKLLKWEASLFDGEDTREKYTVMDKWDVMCDDSRNQEDADIQQEMENFLEFGKRYRITLTIEEIGNAETT